MKIQLVSDLHLEFGDIIVENNNADVLILSGDILVAEKMDKKFTDFLARVSKSFPNVVYVAGNHEFYHGRWNKTIKILREHCHSYTNVHFLEQDTVVIDGVVFVGGTLWTDCNNNDPLTLHSLSGMMNDYRLIRVEDAGYRPLKPADTIVRHKKTVKYIQHVLDQNKDKKCVVVGHHSPSFQSVHKQHQHDTLMNGGYHSNLCDFILDHPQIKLWTHGHTHYTFDYLIGTTRVVCNPRGYHNYSVNPNFDSDKIIEI